MTPALQKEFQRAKFEQSAACIEMTNLNTSSNERELLLKLQQGDETAFEAIYREYSAGLFGFILRLVKDRDAAEDLLQELFIKAWDNRAGIDPDKSYRSFLFTIAKHIVYNYFRRASLEVQVAAYLASQASELYHHVEEELYVREYNDALQHAIDNLPPKRREVYIRCKIAGKSYQQVADELGCSVAAVNAHVVKATKTIKERLGLTEPIILAAITAMVELQLR